MFCWLPDYFSRDNGKTVASSSEEYFPSPWSRAPAIYQRRMDAKRQAANLKMTNTGLAVMETVRRSDASAHNMVSAKWTGWL